MDTLNAVDMFVIVIFALSMLWGFLRGFIKEAVSLIAWVAAAIIASTFASPVAAHFSGTTAAASSAVSSMSSSIDLAHPMSLAAIAISFVALFILTLLAGSIIGYILSGAVSLTGLGFLNRLLGAAFGLARGYLMVIIFMFVAELTPMSSQPAWAASTFVRDFAPAVAWFTNVVQPGIAQLKALGGTAVQNLGHTATQGYSSVLQSVTGSSK